MPTILTTLVAALLAVGSKLLQNGWVVLCLLCLAVGFHYGDGFGKWRQASIDARSAKHATPAAIVPAVHPLRDLLRYTVGASPDDESE